ncbi:MAG: hypothetical protein ACI3VR_11985, partial [Intestinibacter sp.]|uniref:hypothetical protein n=1 Tax=Intestinibacter sp. TaxID=1965304 RepID=UPI003F146C80
MDDVKSKKTYEIGNRDFFEVLKVIVFSVIGVAFFFFPVFLDKNIVSPVVYISDFVYLRHVKFAYICTILFISLVLVKQIVKKEKGVFVIADILIKILSILILVIFLFKNEFVFFKDSDLVQIMKESLFKLVVFFPISVVFLPF